MQISNDNETSEDHSKVVSETCRCSDVMGDEEDAEPFRLAQLGKKMQEVHLTLTVKAAGGFIANEKSRRRSKRPCDAHAFLLSSCEGRRFLREQRFGKP